MTIMPGVVWRADRITEPVEQGIPLAMVRDDHLRVVNGTIEDAYIERLIKAAVREGERVSWRSFTEQTWRLVLNAVPSDGVILLPWPPIMAVTAVEVQGVVLDPADYLVTLPSGPYAGYGRLRFGSSVAATLLPSQPLAPPQPPIELPGIEPIRITYTAGYVKGPPTPSGDVPIDLQQACLLLVGEFYKQRSLSVQGTSTTPAIMQAHTTFRNYRPY